MPVLSARPVIRQQCRSKRGFELLLLDNKIQASKLLVNAILQARDSIKNSTNKVRFIEGDFLNCTDLGEFDLVVIVRVLTCFPQLEDWSDLVTRAAGCVAVGGLFYVHDFLFTPESNTYRERYREGARRGWRRSSQRWWHIVHSGSSLQGRTERDHETIRKHIPEHS
jgi:hypothetical protein